MESVGPYEKTGSFSMPNDPRSRFLTSFFPNFLLGIHQDPSYEVDWSRWQNRLIFKVKRSPKRSMDLLVIQIPYIIFVKIFVDVVKTLAMKMVGPDGQTDPFSRSNKPRSR
ncbi:hypothetical protein H5410_056679 [Solanum commersonii]|uniref:Uncharacterized protein n=1 Tax=Solanum commersonii TaxID=4109 RepID=A0A9J5WKW5_SOLCO|nr:hypothetical protein H5410_056679 [Solanum commersonii]